MASNTVLFSLAPRLFLERLVIISALFCTFSLAFLVPEWNEFLGHNENLNLQLCTYVLVAVHHVASLLGPLKIFLGIFDLVLLILEIVGVAVHIANFAKKAIFLSSWAPEMLTFHAVYVFTTFGGLICLAIFRFATIVRSRGKALTTPFDILFDQRPSDQRTTLLSMCLGRSLCRARFTGEAKVIAYIRGFLGLVSLLTMVVWTTTRVIIQPMQETALSPIREFRSSTLTIDLLKEINDPVWKILVPFPHPENTSSPVISQDDLPKLMQVRATWDDDNSNVSECTVDDSKSHKYQEYDLYQFICPSLSDVSFLMKFNFTLLKCGTLIDGIDGPVSLPLVIGMTDQKGSIEYIMENTTPIVMLPGVNMVASVVFDIRQVFTKRALATLGLYQPTTAFLTPRIVSMYPDPWLNDRGTNSSTLRILAQNDWTGTRIVQDYRQNSVVAGFANIGGLWTALSGIFTIIFGASMLHFVCGTKPLTIFGLAHSFQRREMEKEILRLYPNVLKEQQCQDDRGLVAFLREHLIDLRFLEKEHPEEPKSQVDLEQPQAEKESDLKGSHLLVRTPTKSREDEIYESLSG